MQSMGEIGFALEDLTNWLSNAKERKGGYMGGLEMRKGRGEIM